jgi:hypothetical protein
MSVDHFLALVRLDVLDAALRASVIAAATPNISPFFAIFGAAIMINELSFRHLALSFENSYCRPSLQDSLHDLIPA